MSKNEYRNLPYPALVFIATGRGFILPFPHFGQQKLFIPVKDLNISKADNPSKAGKYVSASNSEKQSCSLVFNAHFCRVYFRDK